MIGLGHAFINLVSYRKTKEELDKNLAVTTSDLFEQEIQQDILDLSSVKADSEEYGRIVDHVDTLCHAQKEHDETFIEQLKIELQIEEARKRLVVNLDTVLPKVFAILVYGGITVVFICLERQTPLSMRMLRAADALLTPKGI